MYFHIQNLEMFQLGCMHCVGELSGDNYLCSSGSRQLHATLDGFWDWQTHCPNWFKHENLCLADDQDAPSLDEDMFEEPLLPSGTSIMKWVPLVHEPGSQACLAVTSWSGRKEEQQW